MSSDSLTCDGLNLTKENFSKVQELNIVELQFAKETTPTLVIRRLLTTNKKEEEEWIQTMIFRTRVKCEDRLAKLVIDNGSAVNFVAQEIIDKLH